MSTTKVEREYEAGRWVPSYYGNKFSVAQKRPGTEPEQDLTFKVTILAEAQAEAFDRNLKADAAKAVEMFGEDELERFAAQA